MEAFDHLCHYPILLDELLLRDFTQLTSLPFLRDQTDKTFIVLWFVM